MLSDAGSPNPVVEPGGDNALRCSACRGNRTRRLGEKNQYPIWECLRCGTLFTKSWAGKGGNNTDEIRELYDHYYDRARFEIHPVAAASSERLVRSFERFRTDGRWLDIGYGEGGLLEIAGQNGWACYGMEVSPPALQYGERRGWVVSTEIDSDPRFPVQGFDVITMMECIEHVIDPHSSLLSAARLLRPGGMLHLTTPNARSLNRRLLGIKWSIVSPPEHLTLWTGRALREAVMAAGFERPVVRAVGFNPFDLRSAILPNRPAKGQTSRTEMALALNGALSRGPARRMAKNMVNFCLAQSGTGDTLKVWSERTSGVIGSGSTHV
jgi:2-polyprenyl-3-methyl-5-hydroxy-6-metoxy-1,4-benzoquinol methylase